MIDFNSRNSFGGNVHSEEDEKWRREKVLEDLSAGKTNFFYLGVHLLDIWLTRTYGCHTFNTVFNYSGANFFDYCLTYFGLEKSQVSRYMNIVDEFGDGLRGFKTEYADFSYSQLSEMLSLTPKERKAIKPDWTIRRIREYKKELAGKVATSQQTESVKVTKVYGEIKASAKSSIVLTSTFKDFEEVTDENLRSFLDTLCDRLFVGYSYSGYNLTFTDKMKIVSGMLCYASDISKLLQNKDLSNFVNIEQAFTSLQKLGYLPEICPEKIEL